MLGSERVKRNSYGIVILVEMIYLRSVHHGLIRLWSHDRPELDQFYQDEAELWLSLYQFWANFRANWVRPRMTIAVKLTECRMHENNRAQMRNYNTNRGTVAPPRIRGRGFINGSDTKLKAGDHFFLGGGGGEGLRGEFGPRSHTLSVSHWRGTGLQGT